MYFNSKRALGILDPEFIELINGPIIYLTSAILYDTLRAWNAGVYQDPSDFKPEAVEGKIPTIYSIFI